MKLWVGTEGQAFVYNDEHWFVDRPEREIVLMLFEEAKRTFAALYPDAEAVDYSVVVNRLRPADDYRADFRPLM